MYDVVGLGELLIDFTPYGLSNQNNLLFEANPGGAPCNVLSILSNLGNSTSFIGKVGNDAFGLQLKKIIEEQGINSDGIILDNDNNTTLAFVNLDEHGDRSFSFYRKNSADTMLQVNEVNTDIISKAKIFHFGSLSLTDSQVEAATKYAVNFARENGLLISFDPNLRESLWRNLEEAKKQIIWGLDNCNILKVSEEELEFITGYSDIDEGIAELKRKYDILLIFVTLGSDGSIYSYKNFKNRVEGFKINCVDTTGAGDTFFGAMLHKVLEVGIENLNEKYLNESLRFANAAAALVTTKKGAIKSMPLREDIEKILKNS